MTVASELSPPPVGVALAGARSALTEATDAPLWTLGDAELTAALVEAGAAVAQAQAVLMRLVGEADARASLVSDGATSSQAWLRSRLRLSPAEATSYVRTARDLRAELGRTAAACAAGQIGLPQAVVISRMMAELPADRELRRDAERELVGRARVFDPVLLGRLGRRLVAVADPGAADIRDGEALARAEDRAARRADLSLAPDGEGGAWLRGRLDAEGAAVVRAALDPLSGPRPTAADGPDPRPPGRRRAEALVAVCRRALAVGGMPGSGGDAAQVVVTIPFRTLTDGVGVATLDDGTPISATTARRLACDARIVPAVLGGRGEVLDVGRGRRLFTGALRRALVLRDWGCAFPGCDRPATWCEAHHIRSWAAGGVTGLDNGVLLCRHHHRLVERGDWEVRLAADRRPEFVPPAWVDPARKPLRNHLHDRPD